ncbi:MAG: GntR family transcriptional regulator [Acinetobacter sp.]
MTKITTRSKKGSDSLSELVFQNIKNDIFDFKLMPGERFTESEIAQAYQVSRTPIRQALYRLQQDGYVEVHFRSGWQVRPLDFKAYEELYDVRILLEKYAIQQLCHLDLAESSIMTLLKQQWCVEPEHYLYDLKQLAQLDEAFHCNLVKALGNLEMAKIHQDISEKIRIIRRLDFSKDFRIEATYAEHQQILACIFQKDSETACKEIEQHISKSRDEVKRITLEMIASHSVVR